MLGGVHITQWFVLFIEKKFIIYSSLRHRDPKKLFLFQKKEKYFETLSNEIHIACNTMCVCVSFSFSLRPSQWTTSNFYHKRKPHIISKSNAKNLIELLICLLYFYFFGLLFYCVYFCSFHFEYEYIRYFTIFIIVYIILGSVIHGNPLISLFSFFHANKKQHWYELFGVYPFLCVCAKKTTMHTKQLIPKFWWISICLFVCLVISFAVRIKNTHFRAHVFWILSFFFHF